MEALTKSLSPLQLSNRNIVEKAEHRSAFLFKFTPHQCTHQYAVPLGYALS